MFLAALFLHQQPAISFDFEVGPITSAVRKLSEVSGVPLSVEGVAKNETVFLHVDNRPLQEVLDKLAKVTTSQWSANADGGFTLVRPTSLIQNTLVAEIQERRVKITNEWQREHTKPGEGPSLADLESQYGAELKKQSKDKSGFKSAQLGKFIEKAFLMPLYQECVECIYPEKIAMLQLDQRVVFSNSPTPRQVAFSKPIAPKLKELNRNLAQWRNHLVKSGLKAKWIPVNPTIYEHRIVGAYESNATLPFAQPVTSIVLSFNATGYNTIVVNLTLLDAAGQVVAAVTCDQMRPAPQRTWLEFKSPEIELARPLPTTLPTRAVREASKGLWRKERGDLAEEDITRALAPYFDDPVNNDFLKLGNQEFFSIVGPTLKRSVIACIPDGQFLRYAENDVKRFVEGKVGDSTSSAVSENWIEFFPLSPVNHWRSRGNREALARCAKTWREREVMTMRDVTELLPWEAISYPNIQEFAQLLMPRARNDHYNSQVAFTNYRGMGGLLGSLTEPQINQLVRGVTIPYRDLSKSQRSYCEAIVYGVPFHRVIGGNALSWEPTIELPNGMDETMGITAKVIDEQYLLAHDPDDPTYMDIRETMELRDRPERFNGAILGCGNYARANRWMKFDFRTRRRFALRCYLTKGHYYSVDYYEPMEPDKGQRLTVDQLSPSLLAKIHKMNRSFNSRVVVTTDKNGNRTGKTETYQEPKKKKR